MEMISNHINLPFDYLKKSIGKEIEINCKENVIIKGKLNVM
jgi:small nuclear ribonucleoprotein (snRNP)-like protein